MNSTAKYGGLPDSYQFATTALRAEQPVADVSVLKVFGRTLERREKSRNQP